MVQPSAMGESVKASTPPELPVSSLCTLLLAGWLVAVPWNVVSKLAPPDPMIGLEAGSPSPWPLPATGPEAHSDSPFQIASTAPVWPGKFVVGCVLSFADGSVKLFHTRKSRCVRPRLPPMNVKAALVVGIESVPTTAAETTSPAAARRFL